jgi:hypothetical protein
MKTADLSALPDEELATVRPVREPDCKISLRDGLVWAKPTAVIEPLALFPVDAPALTAFNLFNGDHDLQAISQTLVDQTGRPKRDAGRIPADCILEAGHQTRVRAEITYGYFMGDAVRTGAGLPIPGFPSGFTGI